MTPLYKYKEEEKLQESNNDKQYFSEITWERIYKTRINNLTKNIIFFMNNFISTNRKGEKKTKLPSYKKTKIFL